LAPTGRVWSNNSNGSKRQSIVNEVIKAAAELQAVCQSQGWQFCFIGGLALQRWGEPRETVDVDLSLFADFGNEEQFIDVLLKQFEGRISDEITQTNINRVQAYWGFDPPSQKAEHDIFLEFVSVRVTSWIVC
jgi:hypothetical protein